MKYEALVTLEIGNLEANSPEEAEAILNEFIDAIAPIMDDKIHWNECDWEVREQNA